jgi:oxygen-independent coproporphyrinogen-3 oxidase
LAGIYLHIPFCRQACHYCNFHFSTSLRQKDAVVAALLREIELTPLYSSGTADVHTIYFGGGTPSLLPADDLEKILAALHSKFNVNTDAEITLEANPDDIDDALLRSWRQLGINRLSVGIQSFSEEELKWMNRAHTATEALNCIDKIRSAGFDNFSIDLIYGSPLLDDEQWKQNVQLVIEKKVPHISCYALTVEPKTALEKMISLHKKADVDPERQARQFVLLMEWMEQAGYNHYEISNYALPGRYSRHNSSYWQGEPYYGFGPSAHAYDGIGRRSWNLANNALYIESLSENKLPFEEELLTPVQQVNEYIMTALRTREGIDINKIESLLDDRSLKTFNNTIMKWMNSGHATIKDNRIFLSREGKLFADGIAADLFL